MNGSLLCIQRGGCSDDLQTIEEKAFTVKSREGILSVEVKDICEVIFDYVIATFLSYLSILDNVVALVVFTKMGFQDTMNISLSAIAVWDIVKGLCQAMIKFHLPLKLVSEPFAITWHSHALIILGNFYNMAGYVSGVMAAYVSLERCLCVSLPFMVKFLLTRKLVTVVNALISILVVGSYVVIYTVYRLYWVYSPKYNQSIARYSYSSHHFKYPQVDRYVKVLSLIYPFSCFTVICVCSAVTIYFLRKARKFRSSTAAAGASSKTQPRQHSSRDRQITKILLAIIGVYIVTYIPRLCYYITHSAVPEFRPSGRYRNMVWFNVYIMFTFDLLNGAVNPFILYFMSSQFRSTLIDLFRRSKQRK